MASIRKLRGRWQAQVRRRGLPPRAKSFDLRSDAERWARELEALLDRGAFGIDTRRAEKLTMRELLERYSAEISPKKRGCKTEQDKIRMLLRCDIAHYTLASLTSEAVAAFRDARLKTVQPGTVNRDLSIISHAIEIARREWGIHLLNNPVKLIRRPQNPRGRDRRLEPGEEEALLDAARQARNPFMPLVFIFAIETGMRQSEILSLRWPDIDLTRRVAHLDMTKNGDARDVPLSARAVDVLQQARAIMDSGYKRGVPDREQVFSLGQHAVKKGWERAVMLAGIKGLHFHDLRHEAVSRLFEKGFDAMEVSAISGHRSFKMLKRYTHLRVEGLVDRL